ncbi:MAG: type II secretion system F family protein [Candidatus Gracilibacteria bacterium]|jgi:type IV pilus assembly protein PilC
MNQNTQSTHIDIGLSREDQARIEALRSSGQSKGGPMAFIIKFNNYLIGLTKISLGDKVSFFQMLSVMINAGLPIIRSLNILAVQMPNPRFCKVIRALAERMETGKSLSHSMSDFPKVFSPAECGMVASGETSGNLNEILKDMAKHAEESANMLSKVKGAMIYPATIILVMTVCLFLILTMVVPKLMDLFTQGGQELPWSTLTLVKLSNIAQNYWDTGLILLALFILGLILVRKSSSGRFSLDYALLRMPLFGKIVRNLMVARFSRQLASLTNAGIPIVKALEINAAALPNEVYRKRIEFASQDVAQGMPLGENLLESDFLFPPMVSSMVLVGEQTAKVNEVAGKIADFYESEVNNSVANLSKIMEPVILVIMGFTVAFVVAAVMQPIMSLSDLSTVL